MLSRVSASTAIGPDRAARVLAAGMRDVAQTGAQFLGGLADAARDSSRADRRRLIPRHITRQQAIPRTAGTVPILSAICPCLARARVL